MKDISQLTEEERKSINEHYSKMHKPATDAMIEMVKVHIANKDMIGLVHLSQQLSVILKTAADVIEPDDVSDADFPTMGGIQ